MRDDQRWAPNDGKRKATWFVTSGLKDKHTDKVSYDTSLTEEGSPGPVVPDSQPTAVGIPGRLCPPLNQTGVLQQQQTNPATAKRSTGAADNRQPVGTLFSFDTWIGTPLTTQLWAPARGSITTRIWREPYCSTGWRCAFSTERPAWTPAGTSESPTAQDTPPSQNNTTKPLTFRLPQKWDKTCVPNLNKLKWK